MKMVAPTRPPTLRVLYIKIRNPLPLTASYSATHLMSRPAHGMTVPAAVYANANAQNSGGILHTQAISAVTPRQRVVPRVSLETWIQYLYEGGEGEVLSFFFTLTVLGTQDKF